MTENNFNMEKFHHSIYLDTPVKDVYDLFGKAEGLTKWFIGETVYTSSSEKIREAGEYIETGDIYTWHWLAKDLSLSGKVIDIIDGKTIKFTFGSTYNVTMEVKEDSGRSLFTLKQEYSSGKGRNDFAHINCCVCWAFFITNMKSVLEYGNDLREISIDNEELINR